jgi:hypothetical protein
MKNTCNNCLHWRQSTLYALTGVCVKFLDYAGARLSMKPTDFCSKHILVADCVKEPTDAAHVLMTLLIKQVAELQAQMKSLDGQFGHHIHDNNRHLRRPEKYKASNSLI